MFIARFSASLHKTVWMKKAFLDVLFFIFLKMHELSQPIKAFVSGPVERFLVVRVRYGNEGLGALF